MRHNAGHNRARLQAPTARRRGATQLGHRQRELFLFLALQEARVRKFGTADELARLRHRGVWWDPARAVADGVEYDKLKGKISTWLRDLEQRGLVATVGSATGNRRTRFVKLTSLGYEEAVGLAQRSGMPKSTWEKASGIEATKRRIAAVRRLIAAGDAAATDVEELAYLERKLSVLRRLPHLDAQGDDALMALAEVSQWLRTWPGDGSELAAEMQEAYASALFITFRDDTDKPSRSLVLPGRNRKQTQETRV